MTRHVLTILAVEDRGRSADFYRALLPDWSVSVDVPVYLEMADPGGARLGLYQREAFAVNTGVVPAPAPPGGISSAEVYFHVDDLEQALLRIEAAGGRLLSARAPRGWGDEVAYYADPDGHVVALARPLSPG